jgi:hypothetical protein
MVEKDKTLIINVTKTAQKILQNFVEMKQVRCDGTCL